MIREHGLSFKRFVRETKKPAMCRFIQAEPDIEKVKEAYKEDLYHVR